MRNAANDARYWQDTAKDANGNLLTGAGRTVTWNSFNMVYQVTQGANTLTYLYDPSHTRIKETGPDGTTIYVNPRIDTGGHFEKITKTDGTIEYKHYLYAGGQSIGVYTSRSTGQNDTRYFHTDHLGSISVITNESGAVVSRFAYDPFGNRTVLAGTDAVTHHGFTGHEHMEEVGLVNMNGRIYDPALARFMSADPNIQAPGNGQSFNRYSYVFNNPLSYTDPSGYLSFFGHKILPGLFNNKNAKVVAVIAVAYFTGTYAGLMTGSEIAAGAAGGFAGGFVGSGGNLQAGLKGAITGAAMGAVGNTWDSGTFENVAGHAAVGCGSSMMSGGSCGSGALAGGFSAAASPYIPTSLGAIGGAIASAVVGGTASVLGGGKFENGAATGAFGYLFNDLLHYNGKTLRHYDDDGKLLGEYPATSGRNGVSDSKIRDQGPITEGSYTLNPSEIQERSLLSRAASLIGVRADWGQYLAPLHVNLGTETFGRGSYYLHGGFISGSAGCIDVGKYDSTLFPQLMKQSKPIRLDVKY